MQRLRWAYVVPPYRLRALEMRGKQAAGNGLQKSPKTALKWHGVVIGTKMAKLCNLSDPRASQTPKIS